jgi:hypothetical protein
MHLLVEKLKINVKMYGEHSVKCTDLVMCTVQAIHLRICRRDFVARSLTDWLERGPTLMSQQILVSQTIPGKLYYCDREFSFCTWFHNIQYV